MAAFGTGSYTSTATQIASTWVTTTSTTSSATTVWVVPTGTGSTSAQYVPAHQTYTIPEDLSKLKPGREYTLPDGSILKLDSLGNYTIEDKNAKVTYRANRIREFNPYLNCSDLLEDFIRDMKAEHVLQSELLQLPVNLFIHWLIWQAAKHDGDSLDDVTPPQKMLPKRKDRCLCCGRFLPRVQLTANVMFCNGEHLNKFLLRSGMERMVKASLVPVRYGRERPVSVG